MDRYLSRQRLAIQMVVVSMIALQRDVQHQDIDNSEPFYNVYDYIVVGGGTAGCVVARRLSDDRSATVLLLEAGDPQSLISDIPGAVESIFDENPEFDWNFRISPQKRMGLGRAQPGVYPEFKGRVLGGSSTINGMVYLRGNRRDFDNWKQTYGAIGWSFNEVLPYFRRSENNSDYRIVSQNPRFHGTGGPLGVSSDPNLNTFLRDVQKSYNKFGIPTTDLNGPKQAGSAIVQITAKDGFRSSTANAYIEPNPNPNNLFISLNSSVTRIVFTRNGRNLVASAVDFHKSFNKYSVRARREIILCAGSYNSPQLLMLSGIGPRKHLNKMKIPVLLNLPVGNNLQEHIRITFRSLISNNTRLEPFPNLTTPQLHQLITTQSGPLATFTGLYTFFSTKTNSEPNWPNILVSNRVRRFSSNITQLISTYSSQRANEWTEYFRPYLGQPYLGSDILLRRPRSKGKVRLSSSNPYALVRIDPNFLQNSKDLDDLVEGVKFELNFLQNSDISQNVTLIPKAIPGCSLCPGQPIYLCDSYIRCYIRQVGDKEHHSGGTCKMGAFKRRDTVVDPRLRVKYVSGLRVCDASVMPVIPNSNTLAATVMIGEKCAHYIKQDNNYINIRTWVRFLCFILTAITITGSISIFSPGQCSALQDICDLMQTNIESLAIIMKANQINKPLGTSNTNNN